MAGKIFPAEFFEQPALTVARGLLGQYLVRRTGGKTEQYIITETEAYIGPQDLACHAAKGLTPRTRVMFGPPGRWYVYFTYGMHWMLNIVTGREGHPAAVLIRGVEGISGPARLTKTLDITGILNDAPAARRSGLWTEDSGIVIPNRHVRRTPRIGVGYAGEWAGKPYRFVVDKNSH